MPEKRKPAKHFRRPDIPEGWERVGMTITKCGQWLPEVKATIAPSEVTCKRCLRLMAPGRACNGDEA